MEEVKASVQEFETTHVQDTTHLHIKWKALKYYLRGVLNKHGVRLQKCCIARIQALLTKVADLERAHKQTPTALLLTTLSNTRRGTPQYNRQARTARNKARYDYYELANKCGTYTPIRALNALVIVT